MSHTRACIAGEIDIDCECEMPERKPLERRSGEAAGPREEIVVDIAKDSLEHLLEGVDVEHVKFWKDQTGRYHLNATARLSEHRKMKGTPAVDVFVEEFNKFGEILFETDDLDRLRQEWNEAINRFNDRTGPLPEDRPNPTGAPPKPDGPLPPVPDELPEQSI